MRKIKLIIIFFLITVTSFAYSFNEHTYWGVPNNVYDSAYFDSNGQILSREGYVLYFDYNKKVPLWVNYYIESKDLENKNDTKRLNYFIMDPDLKSSNFNKLEPRSSDYKTDVKNKIYYDRGHMVPAADMVRNKKVMKECFYMTNICPQKPTLNRQTWKKLENEVRKLIRKKKFCWISTGPVFLKDSCIKKIGKDSIWVPTHFYKIVIYYDIISDNLNEEYYVSLKKFGFLMPNDKCDKKLKEYIVSIDSIETLTGFDFIYFLTF